jgi:hypothetical protein
MFPAAVPADWGEKDAENVALSFGVSVMGRGNPLRLNPEPLAVA